MKNLPLLIGLLLLFLLSSIAFYKVVFNKGGYIESWRILALVLGYLILNIFGFIFFKKLLEK